MYIPEIKIKYYDDWVTLSVGDIKIGTFFENEETKDMLDSMYAEMICKWLVEEYGVNFLEEEDDE